MQESVRTDEDAVGPRTEGTGGRSETGGRGADHAGRGAVGPVPGDGLHAEVQIDVPKHVGDGGHEARLLFGRDLGKDLGHSAGELVHTELSCSVAGVPVKDPVKGEVGFPVGRASFRCLLLRMAYSCKICSGFKSLIEN